MPYKDYEKQKQNSKENYYKNREKKKKQAMDYYYNNWSKRQRQRNEWLKKNKDKADGYKRKYTQSKKGKISAKKSFDKYKKNNLEKIKARWFLNSAVRLGKIIKPKTCSSCGKIKRLQGHHHINYDKKNYLNVLWLCSTCHKQRHL